MTKRKTLIPLAALLVAFFIGSGVLKDNNSGVLGVLSYICWFGLIVLVVYFITVAVMTIVRNRRRLRNG
ncbi:MAG TPA: hypothetical protein VHU24_00100 [Solirubrobacterales bacterium]|jgi:quinol-cytochrome oxidoreductase complex cytochrome b subunit|nr:hypothetical protein [Solirubrobacterales bacterium]